MKKIISHNVWDCPQKSGVQYGSFFSNPRSNPNWNDVVCFQYAWTYQTQTWKMNPDNTESVEQDNNGVLKRLNFKPKASTQTSGTHRNICDLVSS